MGLYVRGQRLGITDRYRRPKDVPQTLPVFPLNGAILLPRATLPLSIFEPRYLAMIDDVLGGARLIGMIQPTSMNNEEMEESPQDPTHPLRKTGCVGRITAFSENDDGSMMITLTGIARFRIVSEEHNRQPYRVCKINIAPYADDLVAGYGEDDVERKTLLDVLSSYLDAHNLSADWDSIHKSSTEYLVNTLSIISPYGPEEKQALLEAQDLRTRAEILIALAEMELAGGESSGSSGLQ